MDLNSQAQAQSLPSTKRESLAEQARGEGVHYGVCGVARMEDQAKANST
jgi:hypothetical protein